MGTFAGTQKIFLKSRPTVEAITACRACGDKRLAFVGGLDEQYVVAFPTPEEVNNPDNCLKTPLNLVQCLNCKLVQLEHTVNPDRLFKKFWYISGINEAMKTALFDVVSKAVEAVGGLEQGDAVCDVGSNDGTLLEIYKQIPGVHTVGFEPCEELVGLAEQNKSAEVLIANYFKRGPKLDDLFYKWHQTGFKIITACAMFYDLDDPRQFLYDVKEVLHPNGIFVVQMNHLRAMLANCTFDNIAAEHLCYYSFTALAKMLQGMGLQVRDVEENELNGGSLRLYVSHLGAPVEGLLGNRMNEAAGRMLALDQAEQDEEVSNPRTIARMLEHQKAVSKAVSEFIRTVTKRGKKVYVYGASTRGTVILQTLDKDVWPMLLGAADKDERKHGRLMVGTLTPIIPEAEAREKADYFLCLPYSFRSTFMVREQEWMKKGGKMIIPLPEPKVVNWEGKDESLL